MNDILKKAQELGKTISASDRFKAVEKNRLLEGGLWIISDYVAELGSMKFEGHGIIGYNPEKKRYVGTWVDNMTPMISPMEGTYDVEKKVRGSRASRTSQEVARGFRPLRHRTTGTAIAALPGESLR